MAKFRTRLFTDKRCREGEHYQFGLFDALQLREHNLKNDHVTLELFYDELKLKLLGLRKRAYWLEDIRYEGRNKYCTYSFTLNRETWYFQTVNVELPNQIYKV